MKIATEKNSTEKRPKTADFIGMMIPVKAGKIPLTDILNYLIYFVFIIGYRRP